MQKLYIDGTLCKVYRDAGGDFSWIKLVVGVDGPEAQHTLPRGWWLNPNTQGKIHTGGHTYEKAPANG